jgi:NAD(P)-dependent dehydrogenase (short-subunit alcohol dehydrogenase family)
MNMMSKVLAVELGPSGIRVNSVLYVLINYFFLNFKSKIQDSGLISIRIEEI